MADAQANINVNLNTSEALASLRALQGQIASFHTAMAKGNANAVAESVAMQRNLINSINATGKFSASMATVTSTTESFTRSLEKNRFTMGEYFRYAGGASKTFSRFFKSEFDTINKVARERVKTLQTQYIKMGRDANGALKAIAVRPLALDLENLATKTQIAAQRQQLFNQLLRQGSTNLLNWGKNTQWAGRQLMVGFTIPLTIFGAVAAKTFMEMEEQAIRFKRVYGELFTTPAETDEMFKQLENLGKEFTKYGVALKDTMAMAADAAAMGKMGADLLAQVNEASKLAVLGGVEQEQALETTISLTNAFGVAAEELSGKIDFLNAVENQTVVSIEDLTEAIPKAGPVVQQLGGDVEDLAFFLTAMKEGGINASEGANALKSGLASLINPTDKASEMLAGLGINIKGIVEANAGDVKGTVIAFAQALDTLDPLNRARAIEQLFGKFQFSRISTLFQNVIGEGTQAQRVLQLTQASSEELAILTERELKRVESSPLYKFQKAWEDLQITLIPIGEAFLKAVTPIIEFGAKLLEKFDSMSDGAKQFVVALVAGLGVIAPALLMTVGLVGNGVANLIKFFSWISQIGKGGAGIQQLGMQTQYMTQEQLEANAVAASLNQTHQNLRQTFTSEASAVAALAGAYRQATSAQAALLASSRGRAMKPPGLRTGGIIKKYADGVVMVPGPKGAGDIVPAMLSPGEAVIPAQMTKKYAPLIKAMISGAIPGFAEGFDGNFNKLATNLAGPGATARKIADLQRELATNPPEKKILDQLAKQKPGSISSVKALGSWYRSIGYSLPTRNLSHTVSATRISMEEAAKFSGGAGERARDIIKAGGSSAQARLYGSWGFMGDPLLNKQSAQGGADIAKYMRSMSSMTPESVWGRAFQSGGADIFGKDSPALKAFDKAFRETMKEAAKDFTKVVDTNETLKALKDKRGVTSLEDIERKALQKLPKEYRDRIAGAGGIRARAMATPMTGSAIRFNVSQAIKENLAKLRPDYGKYVTQSGSKAGQIKGGAITTNITAADSARFAKLVSLESDVKEKAIAAEEDNTKATKTNTRSETRASKKVVSAKTTQAKTIKDQDGREKVLNRQGRYVDKIRSEAAQRAAETKRLREQEAEQKRLARNAAARERYAQKKLAQQQAVANSAEQRRLPQLGGGARMGIGMALSSVAIGGSMAPGKVGEMSQALVAPALVASSLLMLPPKIALVVGSLAAIGFAIYKIVDSFNTASKEAMALAESLGGGSKAIGSLSEFAGTVSAGAIMDKRREDAFAPYQIQPGKSTFGQAFMESEAGTAMRESITTALKSQDMQAVQRQIINQMTTAVATGALSPEQARSIVYSLGQEMGDLGFAIEVNGKLNQLLGPNGENLLQDPLGVRLEIMQESTDAMQASVDALDASGLGTKLGSSIGSSIVSSGLAAVMGAKIGAAIGTAITPGAGTAVGAAIGGLAGGTIGFLANLPDMMSSLQNLGAMSGAVVANSVILLQQRQEILDSLDIEYEKRIAAARAAGDQLEVERLLNEQVQSREEFLRVTAEAFRQASAGFDAAGFLEKGALSDSLNQAIESQFADNPLMQQLAIGARSQIEGLDFGDTQREYTLKLLLASGDVSPGVLMEFLAKFGEDDTSVQAMIDVMTNLGSAEGGRVLQVMDMFKDETKQMEFLAQVKLKNPSQAKSYLDMFQQVAQTAAAGTVDLQASLEFYLDPANAEIAADYEQDMQRLRAQAERGAIEQSFIISYIGQDVADIIATDQAYFDSLPPVQQVTYVQTIRTIYETYGENYRDTTAFKAWRRTAPSDVPDEGFFTGSAQQVTQVAPSAPGDVGAEPEPQGGGGGGRQTTILDDILKKLRDYRSLQVGILQGWKNIATKLEDLFGGDKGISGFRGLAQQMRDLGAGENLIEMIVGMSPEDYEKYKDELFVFDEQGNLAALTNQAANLGKALDAITLGEFQNEQEKTLVAMQQQVGAARKLVAAGLDWAQAYRIAADAGLAAAIVAETNLANIREIVKLVREVEEISADNAAAAAVAASNAATANLRKVQEFILKNASALSDAQKEAILSDENLQKLVLDPSINPDVLRQALKDAENQAKLDLEIKKLTFTGLQEIFSDGFSKAMEAFSAKEQQIDIKFQLSTEADAAIAESAERQIDDIRFLIDDLEADLTRIRYQEDEINSKYRDRIEALDQISDINEKLSAQQEAQLTVADALSRGDIAAAARAAQEYRQQLAQDNIAEQRDQLNTQKDIEIAAVRGELGRSRLDIESQVAQLQQQILEIEEKQLEPAQRRIELAERLKIDAIESLEILGRTKLEWEAIKNRVDLAVVSSEEYINAMKEALGVVEDIVTYWDKLDDQEVKDLFANVKMRVEDFEGLGEVVQKEIREIIDGGGGGGEKETLPEWYGDGSLLMDPNYDPKQAAIDMLLGKLTGGRMAMDYPATMERSIPLSGRGGAGALLPGLFNLPGTKIPVERGEPSSFTSPGLGKAFLDSLSKFWMWGTGGDGKIDLFKGFGGASGAGQPQAMPAIPRNPNGTINYSQIPQPATAGFAPTFPGFSLPGATTPTRGTQAGLGTMPGAAAGASAADIAAQLDALIPKTQNTVSQMGSIFATLPPQTQPSITGESGIAGQIQAVGQQTPTYLDPLTQYFLRQMPTTIAPGIAGIGTQFSSIGTMAPQILSGLPAYFLVTLPRLISTVVGVTIPAMFAGAALMSVNSLTPIAQWFGVTLPESILVFQTSFIESFATGSESAVTSLQPITDYFTDLPKNVDTAIDGISTHFGNEGTESANAFKTSFTAALSGYKPSFTVTRYVNTVFTNNSGGYIEGVKNYGTIPGPPSQGTNNRTVGIPMKFNSGGLLPMNRVVPGTATYDKVPTILTPGEFVIRKEAVKKYGRKLFESLNSANFETEEIMNSNKLLSSNSKSYRSGSGSNNDGVMYNNTYQLNVNVKSESDPEKIAKVVMTGIKQIENRRIRGNTL